MRHIEQREHVGLVVTLCAEEGDVGMILVRVACQRELVQHLHLVVLKLIDSGPSCVLQADEVIAVHGHSLIALLRSPLQVGYLLHRGI